MANGEVEYSEEYGNRFNYDVGYTGTSEENVSFFKNGTAKRTGSNEKAKGASRRIKMKSKRYIIGYKSCILLCRI
jgi:hypothetical protein